MSGTTKPAAASPSAAGDKPTPDEALEELTPSEKIATPRQRAIGVMGQAWTAALKKLLGYPEPVTAGYDVAFSWGEFWGSFTLSSLTERSKAQKCDMVYLDFGGPVEDGPTNIILFRHDKGGVTVSENCELWSVPRYGWVEILTTEHRYFLDDDCHLRRKPNRLDEKRARRVNMANDAWREVAAEMAKEALPGWRFSTEPPGEQPVVAPADGAPTPSAPSGSSAPSPNAV